MEDTLLIDAAERFVRGEMSPEEKIYFEDLRKNNPELDQAVVEQIFFLNQLDSYAGSKNFKGILHEVENKLAAENFMVRSTSSRGKLVTLWTRYRKTVAVAATIAGVVSLLIATAVTSVNTDKSGNIKQLVGKVDAKVDAQEEKTKHLESQINILSAKTNIPVKTPVESNFRATGFMIDAANNYIVTNAHVVKQAAHRLIVENNKGEQFDASAIFVDAVKDIAIIKITDTSFTRLPALPYTIRKNGVDLGEPIFMLGYPKQEIVYGEGYVSAKNGYLMDTVFCQITTAANEGNSGSPVLSRNGDVIGIVTSTETNATGVVFAVKSANIYRAVDEAKRSGNNIKMNSSPSLKGSDRPTQVKKTEDYVFMIKGN